MDHGIIFGFARFSINWTTGAIGFQLIYFQLFGAGYFKEGNMGPFIIFFSVPVIAIIFWIKRRDLSAKEISGPSVTDTLSKENTEGEILHE